MPTEPTIRVVPADDNLIVREGGQTVLSEPTHDALVEKPVAEGIEPALVKGRQKPVGPFRTGSAPA
ncbi:MAG TPA: hypothetical protein VND54_04980 [Candidatus Saccharimonadales bacterium]|nr:hypothetical protein [Candidatus Saccharimonadales bacterium]